MGSLNRRTFMQLAALASGGLMLGVMPGCANPQQIRMEEVASASGAFQPNVFLTITPDNRYLLAMNKSEMGQGVMTGAAVMVAEELEVAAEKIEPFHAHRPEFESSSGEVGGGGGMQITGGSSSTPENWVPLRRAGAVAREMMISAAAARFAVSRSSLRAEDGFVVHSDGRKLSYGELTKDAAKLDVMVDVNLKSPGDFKQIGKRRTRVDARSKVDGTAIFGLDIDVPNVLRAAVIHPPVMGATARSIDDRRAKSMPGIVNIFSFERGVAVLAEKYWQARAAAAQIEVEWEGGIVEGLNSAELRLAAIQRLDQAGSNRIHDEGDVDDVIDSGDFITIEVTYTAPNLAHAAMEPMNCTVHVEEDRATVWAPSQSPTLMGEAVALVTGLPRDAVKVETTMLGGGFGRRGVPDFAAEAAMIAKRVARPVQLVWTRENDTRAGYYRPAAVCRMRGAVDAKGEVHAIHYHGISQSILPDMMPVIGAIFPGWIPKKLMTRAAANFVSTGSVGDFLATEGIKDTPYRSASLRIEHTPAKTRMPVAFWRSVGHSFNGFMVESFITELAHAANHDPYEFRRALLTDHPRHLGVLDAVAQMSKWGEPVETGWGRGICVHKSFGTYVAQVVEAGLVEGRIRVKKVWCAVDCGIAINPDIVKAQMESGIIYGLSAAIDQEIDIVDGIVQQGNFDDFPTLRMHESPAIDVLVVDSGEDPTGVGEPGLPPVAPALADALFAATGVRLRDMPLQSAWNAHNAESKEER